jgi:hypothetical protein
MDGGKGDVTMIDWHYDLALHQELDIAEERVTGWVLEEIEPFSETVPLGQGPEQESASLAPHQFTQLLTVAQENASVPALVNYLRYQIARSSEHQGWRWEDVGRQIIALLKGPVRSTAESAANAAAERVRGKGTVATDEEQRIAWAQLSRRFLGVIRWRFIQRLNDHQTGEEHQDE